MTHSDLQGSGSQVFSPQNANPCSSADRAAQAVSTIKLQVPTARASKHVLHRQGMESVELRCSGVATGQRLVFAGARVPSPTLRTASRSYANFLKVVLSAFIFSSLVERQRL